MIPETCCTLPDLFAWRVRQTPRATAFLELKDKKWRGESWRSYSAQIQQLAAGFVEHGFPVGGRMAIMLPIGKMWDLCQMAVWHLGGSVVGVDPNETDAHLRFICDNIECQGYITSNTDSLKRVSAFFVKKPDLAVVLDSAEVGDDFYTMDMILKNSAPCGHISLALPHQEAIVMLTSGTSGVPKIMSYTQQQVVLAVARMSDHCRPLKMNRNICWLPLNNTFQRMVNILALLRGSQTYYLKQPRDLVSQLRVIKPDFLIGVPRFYEKLSQELDKRAKAFPVFWGACGATPSKPKPRVYARKS